jgi:hypothetical protein
MAQFARRSCREVGGVLADHAQGLTVVAGRTCPGNPGVVKTLYQEIGWTLMADITRLTRWQMVCWLGQSADFRPKGVATGAIPWRVLENTIHVALFASERGVNVPKQITGTRMVK